MLLGLVGNDIVDLADPDNRASFARPGYVERVLTAGERRALHESAEPERFFWSLFAAKEAAYKLLVKLGETPGLSHRRLEVSPELREVRHRELVVRIDLTHGETWVHALAHSGPRSPRVEVSTLSPHAHASAAGRALLCRMACQALGFALAELSIERRPSSVSFDGFEPPRLFGRGAPTGADVSLSHDGRFVAAALAAR
ncbi:MAG: 4'-phosphopantetheinyl transferase superfamily protein [Myxococcales bacterium]|nr:4'-phosphopantetheinyl transferase superfamily protein [Myxococcales bacterium]